jgi:DHA1 family bicyclomycin/chloramphenicol resistance-like MFS transporter
MKRAFTKGIVLATIILMDLLGGAELELFVPGFPELQSQFNLSPFWVESLLSVNFIGFCLSLFFVGGLADRYGRKPIILLGLLIFIIGSILCLWTISYKFLIVGRFLQGLGAAAPATLSFLIIADSYALKTQQYLMGILNGLMNLAVGAAPVAGSYITMYFHWQGNFIVLLLLGLIVLIMTVFFIPNHQLPKHKEAISIGGYIPVFQSKPLMLLILHIVFSFLPYWIFLGMSSILYIKDLGVSLSQYGYYQGAWAFIFALGSILCGLIINKYDHKKMLYISSLICALGLIIIVLVTFLDSNNPLLITLAFLPFNIGGIIPGIILYPICLNFIRQAKGRVSALIHMARLILTALGLELTGYFYQGSFQNIGIIISGFVFISVINLFFILKNHEIMKFSQIRE